VKTIRGAQTIAMVIFSSRNQDRRYRAEKWRGKANRTDDGDARRFDAFVRQESHEPQAALYFLEFFGVNQLIG